MCTCTLWQGIDPGNEEISSSRWAQYILKCYRSHCEESYDPDSAIQKNVKKCKKLQKMQNLGKNDRKVFTKTGDLYTSKKYETISFYLELSQK